MTTLTSINRALRARESHCTILAVAKRAGQVWVRARRVSQIDRLIIASLFGAEKLYVEEV